MKQLGYKQLTGLSSVKTLADVTDGIPSGSTWVLLQAETQNIRWTDDGSTTPTSTVGMILLTTTGPYLYSIGSKLTNLKFIEAAASAKLNITFYGP